MEPRATSVYIEHRAESEYPSSRYGYAPSRKYPEYPWDDVPGEKAAAFEAGRDGGYTNHIYDMVRSCLYGYGLDRGHFGAKEWNPLGEVINPGDTVVLKPNWVEDKNENKKGGIDCLVTHGSVIRAMIDYVRIALGNTGRIIVGDSPMPDCVLEKLMKAAHYDRIWESCKERGIRLEIMDFREDIVTGFANEVKETTGEQEVIVDLGAHSFFAETEHNVGRYRNGIVDAGKMNGYYHAGGHHRYGINRTVLKADVVINLPKPKTHRKAGYTAALKNYIGICSRKVSIPHSVMGNQKEGGDHYYGPKAVFETEQRIRDMQNRQQTLGHHRRGFLLKAARIPFWLFRRATHKVFFGTGNWYKNDTIWRAILDLNRIMIYADKDGVMHDAPQRRFFSLGDMVVAGHRNGPLAPSPIKTGCLICSEDPAAFDLGVIRLMGLRYQYLPVLNKLPNIRKYPILKGSMRDIMVYSNDESLNGKRVEKMPAAPYGSFIPAEGWEVISMRGKGHENPVYNHNRKHDAFL